MLHLFRKKLDLKKKTDPCNDDSSKYRLRKPSVEHCVVCFKPNLFDYTFEGSEILKMSLTDSSTKEITVNALDLVITKAIWEEDETLNRQEPVEIRVEDKGILKLIFEPSLMPQKGCLRMNFKGNMSEKRLNGFFVYDLTLDQENKDDTHSMGSPPQNEGNSYFQQLHSNSRKVNVMTIFDPCEARRCFPCWDDPAVKMTYDIILVIPKNSVVFGPTIVKATYAHKRDPYLEVVEFKTTPKLSTFSWSLSFGNYEYIEGRTTDNEITVRVYTMIGQKQNAGFALGLVCKAIPFFSSYFGVPLDSQKLDLVAVPDFINAPISSWGIIYFRASDILMEPETAILDMMWISLIICHEITKQWFGALATFDWWNHQWLKEGIATFAKYIFVHQMFPEMEVWTHFVTNIYQKGLKTDGLHHSRPVEAALGTVPEIEEGLDEICLCKTPSLLRMIHRYVGDVPFRKGLQTYLTRYSYGNASTTEFWKCMQEVTSKPIVTMMNSWSQVRGYPILTVTARQEGRSRYLKLTQDRFVYEPAHRDPKGQNTLWSIPLSFSTRIHYNSSVLDITMDTKNLAVTIPDVTKNDWVKINPGSMGFFRVRYPHEMMSSLIYAIREKSMPALDRLNILDDCFAFLLAGYNTTVELLSLLEAYSEDDDYAVWITISNIFDKCLRVFEQVGKVESFQAFGRFIYSQIYTKMGWWGEEDESLPKKMLRTLVIRMMAKFNNLEVVEQCKYLFDGQFGEDPTPIPVDFRYAVYKTMIMYGDDILLKRFIRMYRETDSVGEKDRLAYAIGACRTHTQIMHVLDFAISEDVRRAHTVLIISSVAKTKLGKELAWNFVKENLSHFRGTYSPNIAGKLFYAILEDFTTEDKISEIQEFFKSNPFLGTERTIHKIAESIKINELWLKREKNLTALSDYLESMTA